MAIQVKASFGDGDAVPESTLDEPLTYLGPLAQLRAGRAAERTGRLLLGLWLYGASIALMVEGAVGASPWDVFHLGVAEHVPWSLGVIMIVTSLGVLLAWIPIRQLPGLGTVLNAALLGPFADVNLAMLPTPDGLAVRVGVMLAGVVLCAFATALYVGAQFGPGPRDGLMTGLALRTGWSIRRVRTCLEITVLAAGVALGGPIGVGTIVFALGVGPLTQFFLRFLVVPATSSPNVAAATDAPGAPSIPPTQPLTSPQGVSS